MPGAVAELNRRPSLWQQLHIDLLLLLLLLALAGFGLVVLYSAGGQSLEGVYRQARYLALALLTMVALAQVRPARARRAAPWAYGVAVSLLMAVPRPGGCGKGAQRGGGRWGGRGPARAR